MTNLLGALNKDVVEVYYTWILFRSICQVEFNGTKIILFRIT